MSRRVRIAIAALAALALGLTLSVSALAQGGPAGGQTTTSAGDNQYIDPLANAAPPRPKRKTQPKPSSSHSSSPASSSVGAPVPSQPAIPSQPTPPSGSATSTGATSTGVPAIGAVTVVRHKKRTSASHRKRASTASVVAPRAISTATTASPRAVTKPPSHSDSSSSFPYVYLIVAVCAALGAALLGRHVLLRRAARRGYPSRQ